MNNLSDLLSVQPYKMLRAIVTRLQIRKNKPDQKDIWIQNIHDLWHSATASTFQQLSDQAQDAVQNLAQAHSIPAILWFAEYGEARPAQAPRTKKEKPPWIEPRNVSEELIYSGLLFFENQDGHTNTDRLTLPHDLREKLHSCKGAELQGCMLQVASEEDLQPAHMQHATYNMQHAQLSKNR